MIKKLLWVAFFYFQIVNNIVAQNFTYPNESYSQGCANGNYITSVSLYPPYYVNNTGPSNFPNYTIYSTSMVLYADSVVTIDITTGNNPGFTRYAVFIDYNMNGVFSDVGETIMPSTLSNASNHLTQTFTIPSSITASTLCRLRVICTSASETISVGGTYQYGETEDYTFYAEPFYGFSNYCPNGVTLTAWNNWMGNYLQAGSYYNNMQCSWLIQPIGATNIDLTFEYFETQAGGDFVKVYDGTDASGTLLGSFSGTTIPSTVTASSGSMYITFTSNGSITDNGFQALYHCYNANNCTTDLNPACNGFTHNITNVTIYNTTLNKTSTCTGSNSNYTSFAATGNGTATLNAGGYYLMNATVNAVVDSAKVGAWVDFNHNNNFESTEYFSFGNVLGGGTGNAVSLYVPTNAQSGLTKMRIRSKNPNGNILPTDACTIYTSGETEDYQITIANGVVAPPAPFFNASATNISVGTSVNFTDASTNSPTSWNWTFSGGTPSSSTAQNPSNITYNSAGCYAVTLTATNNIGSNTNTQTCYITVTGGSTNGCDQLFFSEYLEGTANNKALEIYNPTSTTINLAGYAIQAYSNGATTVSSSYNLTGTIAPNDVYVIANPQASATILALADVTNTICQFNGNDAMVLTYNGNVIDVIGEIGINPGTSWTVGTGSTLDNTLVRNSNVVSPANTWSISQTQWTYYNSNTTTNLGSHTSVCATTVDIESVETENKLNLFPNPTSGRLTVVNTKKQNITILNSLGEIVFIKTNASESESIDITMLPEGIYILKSNLLQTKFIKQ